MYPHEWLAVSYFAAIVIAAPGTQASALSKWLAAALSVLATILVLAGALTLPAIVRVWLPHVYLVLGYWLPAILVPSEFNRALESWLLAKENWWRRDAVNVPRLFLYAFELSYLACYVLVPSTFYLVWRVGDDIQIRRFWLSVLLAGYSCYFTIPWLMSRPPRLLMPVARSRPSVASLTEFLLARVSHMANTFPSGHVAVTAAAAVTVYPVSPTAGLAMSVMTVGIAFGAVVGRYHFVVDVILGGGLGVAAGLLSLAFLQ